jgi:hypothetical protein
MVAQEIVQRALMRVRRGEGDHRVGQDHEIRPRAGAIERVGGVRIARVEVRAGGGGQVTAGGESPDADAVGSDSVIGGMRAHEA